RRQRQPAAGPCHLARLTRSDGCTISFVNAPTTTNPACSSTALSRSVVSSLVLRTATTPGDECTCHVSCKRDAYPNSRLPSSRREGMVEPRYHRGIQERGP